ncbi:hypothetical protein FDP41_003984 [Naegleria fowleri]|uniref:EF-hand domain-containing protein n=1 Tax=Naegleria fowleri TaxID=5763 RepID=A0A6A5BUU4_NAEFO|nr:uncharacterized protein FDP41_003984 [Naegleria fowleri]KAF0976689.1 hypothetical protein FDP41_003984 [Naegleria fowleri]
MLSAAEEPRTPTPSHQTLSGNGSGGTEGMDDLNNVSAIQNSSMNGLDASAILDPSQLESTTASSRIPPSSNANSRPSTSASNVMGGKQSSMGFTQGKGEELSPELIKRYTEAFKLYEAKKSIKPGKTPAAEADDGKTKKDGKDAKKPDPKKTSAKDSKKAASTPQPETPPQQPQITILKNHVLLSELIILMRALMKNPKEKDLPIYLSVLPNAEEVTQRGQLTVDEFLKIMQHSPIPNQDDHFTILEAFETFDSSNFQGTIEPEELKNILLNLGETDLMTPEEVQEIIQLFTDPETKLIRYDDFLKTCLSNTDIHDPPPPKPKTTKKSSKEGNKSSAK